MEKKFEEEKLPEQQQYEVEESENKKRLIFEGTTYRIRPSNVNDVIEAIKREFPGVPFEDIELTGTEEGEILVFEKNKDKKE